MQGGGLGENAIVPLNLSRGETADFVITGSWSSKSHKEAQRYCTAQRGRQQCRRRSTRSCPTPATWQLAADAAVRARVLQRDHQRRRVPAVCPTSGALGSDAPLVIDFSSHVASRSRRLEPRGPGLRRRAEEPRPRRPDAWWSCATTCWATRSTICPSAFNYKTVADNQSMYNTPPHLGHLHGRAHLPMAVQADRRRRTPAWLPWSSATSPRRSCCTTSSTAPTSTSTASARTAARA